MWELAGKCQVPLPNAGLARNPRGQRSEVRGQKLLRRLDHRPQHPTNLRTLSSHLSVSCVRDVAAVVSEVQGRIRLPVFGVRGSSVPKGFCFHFEDAADFAAERESWRASIRACRSERSRIARHGTRPMHVAKARQLLAQLRGKGKQESLSYPSGLRNRLFRARSPSIMFA
jgi:hypothetical protein